MPNGKRLKIILKKINFVFDNPIKLEYQFMYGVRKERTRYFYNEQIIKC